MIQGLDAVKIGLVPISKFVFSQEDAALYKARVEKLMTELGLSYVNLDGITSDGMLFKHEDLQPVIRHLRAAGVDPGARGESLGVAEFARIARAATIGRS